MSSERLDGHFDSASKRLRSLRESTGLHQKEFAQLFGIEPSIYNRYETGKIKSIPKNILIAICDKFDLNLKWLMGYENAEKHMIPEEEVINVKRIPELGSIAAELPILAQENIEGYEYVPASLDVDFCIRVTDDSMINARILKGDLVFIREQSDVESGEIAAILTDSKAILKRVYKIDGAMILRTENPNFPDTMHAKKDTNDIVILGKAIQFISEVR